MEDIANKITYCLKMMELTLWMHDHISDEYAKRVFGRLHFIYIDAFLLLAPQLKNLIKKNGKNVALPEKELKRLQTDYNKAFSDIRDKLSAHRQDKPFSEVIEDWYEIQEYK